jgi:hypothetical protein
VQKLEQVARHGDNAAARALIFEVLARVRTVGDERALAEVVPIKRA